MKTYKIKSSAVRAAKKEMGENWEEFASVEKLPDGEFIIELKPTPKMEKNAPGIESTIASVQLLADVENENALKASKKAEIESRKPAFIPAKPAHEAVKDEMAPESKPSLPSFLQIAPPADKPVADMDGSPLNIESDDQPSNEDRAKMEQDEYLAGIQAKADAQANAHTVNIDPLRPRLSTTELPTKKVWHIADEMMDAAKKAGLAVPKRKDVIEECVRRGVAYGTARTQYQHWFKTMNDSACAPIAVIGKDGKVTMPK